MNFDTRKMLVVDLDGTLLRTDMLYENFWSAFGSNWRCLFSAVSALSHGRAHLKCHLARAATVDASVLPYNDKVLAYIEEWRSAGGRAVLVTASDQQVAQAIADHLGIFDEVHGSDGTRNLKGATKAAFLQERFGESGFFYMGDTAADLPVWERAEKAITVDVPRKVRAKVEALCDTVEHLQSEKDSIKPYIKALRPHQWLKNLLVFVPMLAAHQIDGATVVASIAAFVCFSLIASGVYVLNDLLDLSADRAHPRKRKRPFAAGTVPITHGTLMAGTLVGLGSFFAFFISWKFLVVMIGYYLLTTAYSLYLKRLIVVDICMLAALYTIRIFAGSVATSIGISIWLLAFSVFFFLSLAAIKRQAELIDSAERGNLKPSGRGYHVDDLPIISMIAIAAGYVSVLVMTLYVNSPAVMELYARPEALWGVCAILLYWITRAVMIAHRGLMHDDPVVYAAKDGTSQICALIILAFTLGSALL
ncbi:UbiA family prenyltransferase [Agrobacterium sp. ICMP 6402]|uniref:UbiA family prenyltransferase n=1 Tax=Agrobacterium sp. ICMP 6402 TaxID=2292443 RepID=UPI001296C1D2|nr:UbiA family prenyltransferase [Agrobacterium sp. ICMP 6402]MQB13464.1 UbiA family prenyltransferase [Agrobacterium sp. ICMP 6402]